MGHDSAKRLAAQLRQVMKGYGCELKHGQALDAVSKLTGMTDWNALSAALHRAAEPDVKTDGTHCKRCGNPLLGDYCTDDTCLHSDWPQGINERDVTEKSAKEIMHDLGIRKRIRVRAEIHSDDRLFETEFDCDAWFAVAETEQILDLARIDWGGDYAADAVGWFFDDKLDYITELLAYTRRTQGRKDPVGFEVHVNADGAKRWLRWHRPEILAMMLCDEHGVQLVEAQEPEIQGMWDWLGPHGEACDISWETEQEAAINAADVLQLWPEA